MEEKCKTVNLSLIQRISKINFQVPHIKMNQTSNRKIYKPNDKNKPRSTERHNNNCKKQKLVKIN